MYLTYVDETGTDGDSPVVVMVGIVANSLRLNRTRTELDGIFKSLDSSLVNQMTELKSNQLLRGKGPWRKLDRGKRSNVVGNLCEWLVSRQHKLALAAVWRESFRQSPPDTGILSRSEWQATAWHIALQIQRCHQSQKNNKGHTLLMFDDNSYEVSRFIDSIYDPPAWTDSFYGRKTRADPLDQVIDAFAVHSHHIGLVQVADLLAAIFRRYVELIECSHSEEYGGEKANTEEWVRQLTPRLLAKAHRLPSQKENECAQWFRQAAPLSLVTLG